MRWRAWGDAAAVVGVLMSVLLLARAARPFVLIGSFSARGVDLSAPPALVWARLGLASAIVLAGMLGWWLVAALVGWAAVVVEAVNLDGAVPGPVAATMLIIVTLLALLLTVPGGFRRGRGLLGPRRLAVLGGGGLLIALSPEARLWFGEMPAAGSGVLFAIDSRLDAAITVTQYVLVAALLIVLVAGLPRSVRLRAFAVLASISMLLAGLLVAGDAPFGLLGLLSTMPHYAAFGSGLVGAIAIALLAEPLIDRVLDPLEQRPG